MRTSWMLGLALLVAPVGAAMAAEEPAPINYGPPRLVATLADKGAVELCYTGDAAVAEAARCLKCDLEEEPA